MMEDCFVIWNILAFVYGLWQQITTTIPNNNNNNNQIIVTMTMIIMLRTQAAEAAAAKATIVMVVAASTPIPLSPAQSTIHSMQTTAPHIFSARSVSHSTACHRHSNCRNELKKTQMWNNTFQIFIAARTLQYTHTHSQAHILKLYKS